jgi:hypothetical protein
LLSALTLPVLAGLYLAGVLNAEFFASPGWSIVYTSFSNISGLLSLPIWICSFTLLYFDSRVRQEAYDVDLLAREINPGFYWQPTVQPSAFGYQVPMQPGQRTFVQTSPLGLAGYRYSPDSPTPAPQTQTESVHLREKFERAAERLGAGAADPGDALDSTCKTCGVALVPGAGFCMNCGSAT